MLLRYERTGSGPPLVLIHGLGSARTVWKLVTPKLARSFDVIAVDLPGHGETRWVAGTPMDAPALATHVAETLASLGVERPHLLGNSLGGWTALELAASHPERVASVVALAPGGMRDVPSKKVHPAFRINRYLAVAARPLLPYALRSERMRRLGFAPNSPLWKTWSIETCRDAAEAMALSPGYEAALVATVGRVADRAVRIPQTIPVTIVFGDTDRVLPPTTSQSRRHLPPHGQWLEWERCGHAIQLDYPDRVVELVQQVAQRAG